MRRKSSNGGMATAHPIGAPPAKILPRLWLSLRLQGLVTGEDAERVILPGGLGCITHKLGGSAATEI